MNALQLVVITCLLCSTGMCKVFPSSTPRCKYKDQEYQEGVFKPEPCVSCSCNGTTREVTCGYVDCPDLHKYGTGCVKSEVPPGKCCPDCLEYGCTHKGRLYDRGATIPSGPCSKCYCPYRPHSNPGSAMCFKTECGEQKP